MLRFTTWNTTQSEGALILVIVRILKTFQLLLGCVKYLFKVS